MPLPAISLAAVMTGWSCPCPPAGRPDMMSLQVSMQPGLVCILCAGSSGRLLSPGMPQAVLRPQAWPSRGGACVQAWSSAGFA